MRFFSFWRPSAVCSKGRQGETKPFWKRSSCCAREKATGCVRNLGSHQQFSWSMETRTVLTRFDPWPHPCENRPEICDTTVGFRGLTWCVKIGYPKKRVRCSCRFPCKPAWKGYPPKTASHKFVLHGNGFPASISRLGSATLQRVHVPCVGLLGVVEADAEAYLTTKTHLPRIGAWICGFELGDGFPLVLQGCETPKPPTEVHLMGLRIPALEAR